MECNLFERFSYEQIGVLDESHGVFLLKKSGCDASEIFVGKILNIYNIDVYMFLKEHPVANTPKIIDFFEIEINGKWFLLLIEEYIEGKSLKDILVKGCLSENETIEIIFQLASIVEKFHHADMPIVHRDIKPSNIIIGNDNIVKLLDMNAAKIQKPDQYRDTELIGTVGYAAPEQYGFSSSDIRTDIYSIGVLMNVMLTGKFPVECIAEGRLGDVIIKCVKLDPDERFQNIAELKKAISNCGENKNIEKEEKYYKVLPPGFRKLNPLSIVLSSIGYLVLIIVGLSMDIVGATCEAEIWINRIAFTVSGILIILFSGNYMGIQNILRIKKIQSKFLQILLIVFIDFLIMFIIIGIMNLIISFLQPGRLSTG